MTGILAAAEFRDFFQALHSFPPFPWQERLLYKIADDDGRWPDVLDLPTGSGKTAALDVAVFHLAMEADKREGRRAPVRIAFVVDRRIIVDEAFERAKRIETALASAQADPNAASVLRKVAARLELLAEPGAPPLVARRLRGGVPREDDWARTPSQPTILCSTVDQVGSRLLFRGYGISDRMKPVHAGLLGSDCLILLDEAHLSQPFRQTLAAVAGLRLSCERPSNTPFAVALMSATPGKEIPGSGKEPERFALLDDDQEHPRLRKRLEASKPARLVLLAGARGRSTESVRETALVEQVDAALVHLGTQPLRSPPVIGIVVNRVVRARHVFQELQKRFKYQEGDASKHADVSLVIGPAREIDRDELAKALDPIKTGRRDERQQLPRPSIIVATQTIEAGADLDFDALIAEVAALDALKQRFGRLNRDGREFTPYAAILAHPEDIGSKADDPVYGPSAARTWQALQNVAAENIVDFGIAAFPPQLDELAAELVSPAPDAPVLMPAYADLWSQTSPVPAADPEISLFLHGPDRSPATVQIVWRADLDLNRDGFDVEALLSAMPPRPAEAVEVSLAAARHWLCQEHASDFSDAPSRDDDDDGTGRGRSAFRWAGADDNRTDVIYAHQLRPNDLIVVPASYGGCDEFGWNPDSPKGVEDVADRAAAPFAARRYALRLIPALIRTAEPASEQTEEEATGAVHFAAEMLDRIADFREGGPQADAAGLIRQMLRDDSATPPKRIADALKLLAKAKPPGVRAIFPYGEDDDLPRGVVLLAPKGVRTEKQELAQGGVPATEDDRLGLTGEPQTLDEHCCDVRQRAREFADTSGLVPEMAEDVALAAYLHDAGKADPRFQAMLYGGDWFALDDTRVLAKSKDGGGRAAWEKAGLPTNWRHEALSVRIALEHAQFQGANDRELVLWLVGVHHGFGRPLFPFADGSPRAFAAKALGGIDIGPGSGPESLSFTIDGHDWPQIFEKLRRRYGAWELARLEAIVRLADHRASEVRSDAAERGAS